MNLTPPLPHKAWYLIHCKSGQDERAELNLVNQGYICLRPVLQTQRVLRGKWVALNESLFPSYLFIQLGLNDNWASLRSTRGVSRIVSFGGHPLPVRDEVIARLHPYRQPGPADDGQADKGLAFGDKVCIHQGGLAPLEAIFLSKDGEERVVLLLKYLHRERHASLPVGDVRKR